MRDYGKVHTSFWSSDTIRRMSEDGRILALYLMTSPHTTIAGVFRLPDGYASEDLNWTCARVAKGFAELLREGFANRCETTKWVWISKHLDWNQPENPNQRKAAAKCVAQVPDECAWKQAFMRVCGQLLGLECDTETEPLANPSETLPKPGTGTGTEVIPPLPPKGGMLVESSALIRDGLTEQTATEFLAHRKRKRAPLTPRAWSGIKGEAAKAGWPLEAAIVKTMARGWQSFDASFVAKEQAPGKAGVAL